MVRSLRVYEEKKLWEWSTSSVTYDAEADGPPRAVLVARRLREGGGMAERMPHHKLDRDEGGVVDAADIRCDGKGNRFAVVRVRTLRIPQPGDKLTSRHGQKGVIARLVPQQDMPFCEQTGMVPDIIINPHALPSRMTIGQLLESAFGKVVSSPFRRKLRSGAKSGQGEGSGCAGRRNGRRARWREWTYCGDDDDDEKGVGDGDDKEEGEGKDEATVGRRDGGSKLQVLRRELRRRGLSPASLGKEPMVAGETGEVLLSEIFIGPTYYLRLKHLVQDKVSARGMGAVQPHTRQPDKGRRRHGGLRVGEMERDCLVEYGAASALKERHLDLSDAVKVAVCRRCRRMAAGERRPAVAAGGSDVACRACGPDALTVQVEMPGSLKLVFEEMRAMGIAVAFTTTGMGGGNGAGSHNGHKSSMGSGNGILSVLRESS